MDASRTPRFAGPPTFALLPRRDEVSRCDVAVVGVPFDSGTSYRPGARFGPAAVRQGSRLLRVTRQRFGPVALVHFDAHLDTWQTYFGAPLTHGTPFRRAAEDGLFLDGHSMHIGIRGPLYAPTDLTEDAELGFKIVTAMDVGRMGADGVAAAIRERAGDNPLYLSIDIDVLDPAHAPGTGTPEAGGLTSRELLGILRGLAGMRLAGADVVEVAPAYDHAEVTTVAAAHVCYELLGLMALGGG
jgi:agmatinase